MVHQTWVGAPDAVNGNGIEAFEPGATLWLAQSTVPEIQFTASLHSPAELPKAMATVTSLLTWSAHRKPKQRRQAVSSRRLQSAGGRVAGANAGPVHCGFDRSGSLAVLAAIRCASSWLSSLAAPRIEY